MIHLKKYALLFAVIVSAKIWGQEATSGNFSLQQSIEYALKNSPNYLNAELDQKSAEHKRKEVAGLGLPQINGSIDIKDYLEIPTSLLPGQIFGGPAGSFIPVKFGTKYNATAGVSASQLLFSSDYIFGLKASKEFINLSRISVTRSKADLVAQVSKAYYNVIINKERAKILDINITRWKKTLDDTKASNKEGFSELIEVERLEVLYNNLAIEKEKIDRLIILSETLLKFQMGYKLQDPIVLTDGINVESGNFEELGTKVDVTKRPDYQLLKAQQNLLDLDVKRLKWGYLPTLAAYGSYQYNKQRNEFDFFSSSNNDPTNKWFKIALIGATLNVNIFDGLQRHHKIQQAKITALKNQNTIKNIEMFAEFEANSASVSYNNAYSSLLIQKKNTDLAQHILDVAQKKYDAGVGTNLEVVLAESSLKEAQTNYFNSVYDMIVAKIDYQKAIGILVK